MVQWYRIRLPIQETQVHYLAWEDPLVRKWLPTPVFLAGKSYGQNGLAGCSPWDCKESDMTEQLNTYTYMAGVGWGKVVVDTVSVNVHPLWFLLVCWKFSKIDCGYACLTLQTHQK